MSDSSNPKDLDSGLVSFEPETSSEDVYDKILKHPECKELIKYLVKNGAKIIKLEKTMAYDSEVEYDEMWRDDLLYRFRGYTSNIGCDMYELYLSLGGEKMKTFEEYKYGLKNKDDEEDDSDAESHRIAFFLHDLAADFHVLWNRGRDDSTLRFIREDEPAATAARLALVAATASVIRSGLGVMGVTPVEEMR